MCPERDASTHHIALDDARTTAVREAARLLDADPSEIALVESTTHGLNVIAASIPFSPEENVVICDLEFLQVAIPWTKLAERGVISELRVVRNRGGALPIEAFAQHIDGNTRAVVVSSVQWTNGYAVDLAGARCTLSRPRGAPRRRRHSAARRLPAQHARHCRGRRRRRRPQVVERTLRLRDPLRARLDPARVENGVVGIPRPRAAAGWLGSLFRRSRRARRCASTISRRRTKSLEINGTANYPGAVGLGASLELINALGIDTIEEHVLALTDRLHEELQLLGVDVVTRPEREVRSGITTFEVSRTASDNEAFVEALLDEGVYVALRYTSGVGGIRISTHFYNDHSDLDRLLAVMSRLLGRSRAT